MKSKTSVLKLEPGVVITLAGRDYEVIRHLHGRLVLRSVTK